MGSHLRDYWRRDMGDTILDRAGMIVTSFIAGCIVTVAVHRPVVQRTIEVDEIRQQVRAAAIKIMQGKFDEENDTLHTMYRPTE